MISKEEKIHLINNRIIKLNQKKDNMIIANSEDGIENRSEMISGSILDIDLRIQALTNLIEML